jgi:sigma-E factor negative regulatory protein RseA
MMNRDDKEWLSALADGELQGEELTRGLDALRDDPALQGSWRAYHLLRDGVSSNLNREVAPQLHQRISAALEAEPTVLAPRPRRHSWFKQAAGVAIAASVTGVAIIGVQRMNSVDSGVAVQLLAQQDSEYIRIAPTLVADGEKQDKANRELLDRYLVNHNEYSANSGIQGVLPYVRIVGYEASK